MRGYDDLELRERRKLCRALIRKGRKTTADEECEMTVLMLMGIGMTEAQARADVRLRERQVASAKAAVPWWAAGRDDDD